MKSWALAKRAAASTCGCVTESRANAMFCAKLMASSTAVVRGTKCMLQNTFVATGHVAINHIRKASRCASVYQLQASIQPKRRPKSASAISCARICDRSCKIADVCVFANDMQSASNKGHLAPDAQQRHAREATRHLGSLNHDHPDTQPPAQDYETGVSPPMNEFVCVCVCARARERNT